MQTQRLGLNKMVIMKLLKGLLHNEQGNAIVFVSLAFMGFLSITGLVIDGGSLYLTKSRLQKTANATVLSAAQELTNSEEAAKQVMNDVLNSHHDIDSLKSYEMTLYQRAVVDLTKNVPLTFSTLLGFKEVPVTVHAAAELRKMGRARGAAPLGIDEKLALNYETIYSLKVDEAGVDTGNFGILSLGGDGAKTYYENLRDGYENEIKVGDILQTQTGNVAGKTKAAIKEKLDSCPYQQGETNHRDCPRVILIPVYEEYEREQNQLKQVRVKGFSYFYLIDQVGDKDIRGRFIKRTGTGFEGDTALDRGAYSIRLTE
jgi:hypothetical protein